MPVAPDLLKRLDQAIAVMLELRAELVASLPTTAAEGNGQDASDDFGEFDLIDPTSGQARFGVPQDTLRKWARETAGTDQAVGIRRGGRWLLSIARVRRHCGLE